MHDTFYSHASMLTLDLGLRGKETDSNVVAHGNGCGLLRFGRIVEWIDHHVGPLMELFYTKACNVAMVDPMQKNILSL